MLNQPTIDRLRELKLPGMAIALQRQLDQPDLHRLAFEERLALLIDAESVHRDAERLKRLLRQAQFRQHAALEDLDTRAARGLDRSLIASLASGDWILNTQNLVITGPTGTGKSWIAQAFGNAACRLGFSVRYERTGRLLEILRTARADASYHKRLTALAKVELLILDDFGLNPLQTQERLDLLEILEDRHQIHSTIITSQLPITAFHQYLNEPTVADAILDRLLHRCHRIDLTGDSLRKRKPPTASERGRAKAGE